jgi:DNA mismatch repair protein MutS2
LADFRHRLFPNSTGGCIFAEPKQARQVMIYPENFEEKIGFSTIKSLIERHILCQAGKARLDKIRFSIDFNYLQTQLNQVNELAGLLRDGINFPQQDYLDPSAELIRIKTPGTAIEPESLHDLKVSLNTITEILFFLKKQDQEKVSHLMQVVSTLDVEPSILKEIHRIIDDKGIIRSNASPALKEIRISLERKKKESDSRIAQIFSKIKKEGITGDDLEIAIRNGRQVIPVPAAFKRRIHGFVHDESATGQTVYIEPAEIFELNNEIRELENAEIREIIKILTVFADFLRPHIENLLHAYHILGEIDFIRARAKFAIEVNGRLPFFKNEAIIDWTNAFHPLLFLSHQKHKKPVVPLTLRLNKAQRILVVSGPNAGGKSVALKTTGLLQYMLQCGLLIPVEENSTSGIFNNIFIDIGDEQSLEQDLSTYTSHLRNLRHFIENADSKTLILIDEFGTGTEPHLGGAIAEATLEEFAAKSCFGVITTHYANLKEVAERVTGVINGAMLFDPVRFSPLFILQTGKPGSSYAFEIAEKIGFPKRLLDLAAGKLNKSALDYDKLLQELEAEKSALLEKKTGISVADEFLNELIEKYKQRNAETKSEKDRIIREAREEAARIIDQSNKLIENTIRKIKESQAEKATVRELRQDVKEKRSELETEKQNQASESPPNEQEAQEMPAVLEPGSWVRIKNQNVSGRIVTVREQEVVLEAGQMILHVSPDKLVAASPPVAGNQGIGFTGSGKQAIYQNIHDRSANFKLSIDLRGKKADEAIQVLRRHVDDAILLGIPEITIIHGKGDGILRKIVRDWLKDIKEVKNLSEGHPDRGGAGITVVGFKL